MKPDQSNENRLDGSVMSQVSGHQNNINMGIMDSMGVCMPMMMSSSNQQQITSVPMDNTGSSVQNVQSVAGPSTQTTHDQITQNQTNASLQQEEEEESSEEEENSDDECDGDEGMHFCFLTILYNSYTYNILLDPKTEKKNFNFCLRPTYKRRKRRRS